MEQEIIQREPAFHQIRDKLSEDERDALDMYISACEDYIRSAYQLGWHHCAIYQDGV